MNEGEHIQFEMDGMIWTAEIVKILSVSPYRLEIKITQYRDQEDYE